MRQSMERPCRPQPELTESTKSWRREAMWSRNRSTSTTARQKRTRRPTFRLVVRPAASSQVPWQHVTRSRAQQSVLDRSDRRPAALAITPRGPFLDRATPISFVLARQSRQVSVLQPRISEFSSEAPCEKPAALLCFAIAGGEDGTSSVRCR